MADRPAAEPVANVFVSYAHDDAKFVERLKNSLAARNVDIWLDTDDIRPSTEWAQEIDLALRRADAVIFVISPDSVLSEYCRKEIARANELVKRVIPVVCRHVPPEDTFDDVRRYQRISFIGTNYDHAVDDVVAAVSLDIVHVHKHTELLGKSMAWEASSSDRSRLLTGSSLREAEAWQAEAQSGKDPAVAPIQARYIARSRVAATRRGRTLFSAVALVTVLILVLATIAFVQRDRAIAQAHTSTARLLGQLSTAELSSRIDHAQVDAVAAYETESGKEEYSSLMRAVAASPSFVRATSLRAPVSALAGATGADRIAIGLSNGDLVSATTAALPPAQVETTLKGVAHIATDGSGAVVAASDGTEAVLWSVSSDGKPLALTTSSSSSDPHLEVKSVAVSHDGSIVAVVRTNTDNQMLISLYDDRGRRYASRSIDALSADAFIGFADDSRLVATLGTSDFASITIPDLRLTRRLDGASTPADSFTCCGFAPNGEYTSWAKYGTAHILSEADVARTPSDGTVPDKEFNIPVLTPDQEAVSADGTSIAVAGGGELYYASTATMSDDPGPKVVQLAGSGNVSDVTFYGSGQRLLATSTAATLMFWNIDQPSRLAVGPLTDSTAGPLAGDTPSVSFSDDGSHLAVTGGGTGQYNTIVVDVADPARPRLLQGPGDDAIPVWSPGSTNLTLVQPHYAGVGTTRLDRDALVAQWPALAVERPAAARLTSDARELVVVSGRGDTEVLSCSDGKVLRHYPGPADQTGSLSNYGYTGYASISDDARLVAFIQPSQVIRILDTLTGAVIDLPKEEDARVVAFSGDDLLVGGTGSRLEVWRSGGAFRSTIESDSTYAWTLAPIPGQGRVARLTSLGTIEIWDYNAGVLVTSFTLPAQSKSLENPWDDTGISATRDGTILATATMSGYVGIWQLDPKALIRRACSAAGTAMTVDDWRSKVGGEPPDELACSVTG